ncbi:MAG: branched-chain amino acid ABC transporter permease [Thermoleophilia bacterium]|nr:branched-chain amino acid ABC transporter permease [Thermoleophilia bacterium]
MTTNLRAEVAKKKLAALTVVLAIVLALPWLVGPYTVQLFILTMTYGMLGLSFAFTIRVGLPRFDSAAWWGIGAYTTAMLITKAGLSYWLTIPIAGLVSVVLGYLVYRVAIPRGMMVFLMFGMVIALAIQQLFGSVEFFGGWGGTDVIRPPAIGGLVFDSKRELYYLGVAFIGFNLLCYYLLIHSRIGRSWSAIGQSVKLASSVGIDVVRYRMANVLISNFFLALAGTFYMAFSLVAVPATFGLEKSLNVIMYVVIGGISYSLVGPLVGALILAFVPEYLRVASEYESIITSVVIILVVIFLPGGVLGWLDRKVRRRLTGRGWTPLLGRAKKEEEAGQDYRGNSR